MKKFLSVALLGFILLCAFNSNHHSMSGIYGTCDPSDAARKVSAINGKDTVTVLPEDGRFSIAVTPGTWILHVDAVKPYKAVNIEKVVVVEDKLTDAGVIRLSAE